MPKQPLFTNRALIGASLAFLATTMPQAKTARESVARPTIALMGVAGCVDGAHLQALRQLGDVTLFGQLDEKHAVDALKGKEIVVANPYVVPMTGPVLESTNKLRLLVLSVTGVDRVDTATAARKGIHVSNMADYSLEAVAEDTIALLLSTMRHIPQTDAAVRRGQFVVSPADEKYVGVELSGKTLGIVGLGRIGTRVAEIAQGFGMKVIAWDRTSKSVEGVTQVSLEELLAQSDVVSLHLALTKETAGILGATQLKMLKPTAVLVNTARAELLDESALYSALYEGKLAGAGLDVLTEMNTGNPLLSLDNVVLSPHAAYHSRESRARCADTVVDLVRNYMAQIPRT